MMAALRIRAAHYQRGIPFGLGPEPGGASALDEARAAQDPAVRAARLWQVGCALVASGDEPSISMGREAMVEASQLGHAGAQVAAGAMLLRGDGGPADPDGGIALWRAAAEAGSSQAALLLGKLLWCTRGAEREGVRWLRAAQEHEAEALYLLGLAHFRGQGVRRNRAAARRLQLEAAQRGIAEAQVELAILLEQGIGGPVDMAAARRWRARAGKRRIAAED